MAGLLVWKKEISLGLSRRSPEMVSAGKRRTRSFHVEGPKTEKAQEPAVEILVRGIWTLRLSKAQRRVREGSARILIVLNAPVFLFSI